MICRYIIRIAMSGLSVKFTHWVKVRVTGYHHTGILSTTVAHPDKYSKTYGGGPRVADPGADLQGGGYRVDLYAIVGEPSVAVLVWWI